MRYDEPALRQALAAEYVLGALRGAARRRFERLLAQRPDWRDEVERWSTQLAGLAAGVRPVEPPATLWPRIAARLEAPKARPAALRWWQALAAFASLVAVVLGIALLGAPDRVPVATQTAVLRDQQARSGWTVHVVAAKTGGAELRIVAEAAQPLPGRSFELWALPGGNARPVSLGLLPKQGGAVLPLSAQAFVLLQAGAGLAVSIEPAGGSPTGQPTGPVAYQGTLTRL